ncbi:hypothetical protein XENTR_v10001514 [Xenopus tropicalis]|nr:hypothetical protein XENTR_v10001514 [Xenopus tropicalis]
MDNIFAKHYFFLSSFLMGFFLDMFSCYITFKNVFSFVFLPASLNAKDKVIFLTKLGNYILNN